MAGGAQLIGDLLQGAFSSDNINTSPAAGGYAYTPDQQLQDFNAHHGTNYKSIDEAQNDEDAPKGVDTLSAKPIYYDKTGKVLPEGTVKSPDDLLPYKKPGFFQRAFAPSSAETAIQGNRLFSTEPELANLQHRTAQDIGARDFSTVQPAIGSPATKWTPTVGAIATGNNPTMQGIAGANIPSLEMGAGVPQSDINTRLASNTAAQTQDVNATERALADRAFGNTTNLPLNTSLQLANSNRQLTAYGNQGGPEAEATADVTGAQARTATGEQTIALTPQETQAQMLKLDGIIKAQPALNRALLASAGSQADMEELKQQLLPYLKEQGINEAIANAYLSRFVQPAPPIASTITPEGNITQPGLTGTRIPGSMAEDILKGQLLSKQIGLPSVSPFGSGAPIKLSSGRTVINNSPINPIVGKHINDEQDEEMKQRIKQLRQYLQTK